MALSFVTIHPALHMTTRLVGRPPQPITRTPGRSDPICRANAGERCGAHTPGPSRLFLLYNIITGPDWAWGAGERGSRAAATC